MDTPQVKSNPIEMKLDFFMDETWKRMTHEVQDCLEILQDKSWSNEEFLYKIVEISWSQY